MVLALLLLAMPARIEGPVLVAIGPGHALSVLDSVALAPLLVGAALLYGGLWRRPERLREFVRLRPLISGGGLFVGGLGLGLLLASAFSAFFWWWAIGAALFGVASLGAVLVSRQA